MKAETRANHSSPATYVQGDIVKNPVTWPTALGLNGWMDARFQSELVSVILPTYNRAALIGDALGSVWRQTYRPIELLVVDNGSTDRTADLLREWIGDHSGDPGFHVRCLSQPKRGAPAARNLGLVESRGEYVQFLDSDDVFHPRKLELHVRVLGKHACADYVWSDWTFVDHSAMEEFLRHELPGRYIGSAPRPVSGGRLSWIPTKAVVGMFRRRLCLRIGPWEESLVRHQDWEYMTRVVEVLQSAWHLPGQLYVIRRHDQGRIDDLKKDRRVALQARLAAAHAAERYVRLIAGAQRASPRTRRRLMSRYLSLLKYSLRAGSVREWVEAWAGIRRNWLWNFK